MKTQYCNEILYAHGKKFICKQIWGTEHTHDTTFYSINRRVKDKKAIEMKTKSD